MLQSAAMSPRALHAKKDQQMNVRFTAAEIEALDQIAEIEDRDRAYLVGFFTRWGMEQYRRVGSLVVLRKKNFPHDRQFTEVETGALSRLKLREEAKADHEQQESDGGSSASSKKSH